MPKGWRALKILAAEQETALKRAGGLGLQRSAALIWPAHSQQLLRFSGFCRRSDDQKLV